MFFTCSTQLNAQPYPAESYIVDDYAGGLYLEKWLGNETDIDMEADPVLCKVTLLHSYAFQGNTNLKSIRLAKSLKILGAQVFEGCSNLSTVIFPDELDDLGFATFRNCESLSSVSLPHINNKEIPNYTFSQCTKLSSVQIPEGISKIESEAFYKCSSLEDIVLPNSLREIGQMAFWGSHIKSIILPEKLETINKGAFLGVGMINEIRCYAIRPPKVIGEIYEFISPALLIEDCFPLYVPDESIGLYLTTSPVLS